MANTTAFYDRPSVFVRVSALWTALVEIIRETRALRARYGYRTED